MNDATGEIYDIGYQRYEGPREGRMRARKALWTNGVRTILGLGRGVLPKVIPTILASIAALVAVIFAIIAAQDLPTDEQIDPAGYYQVLSFFVLLFAAVIAPDLVCPDRRDNVIHLYLVRPMSPTDYVVTRWLAVFAFLLAVLYLGQVLVFAGLTLGADKPLDYIQDNWLEVPRFLGGGLVLALYAATLPLAVSAFTTRRGYAQAFIIGLFFISVPFTAALTECEEFEERERGEFVEFVEVKCEPAAGKFAKWVALGDLTRVPVHVSDLVFDKENNSNLSLLLAELPDVVPVGWFVFLIVGPGLAAWWRYQRITL